jgi:hypothetical protein
MTTQSSTRATCMKLSLGQAAKETGLDKSTISRAIKSGKLSAERQESGRYEIDPAELFRVFSPAAKKPDPLPTDVSQETLLEHRELHIRLEAAELRIRDKEEEIRDLRRRLDAESEELRQLTLMLLPPANLLQPIQTTENNGSQQDQTPQAQRSEPRTATSEKSPKRKRFWAWLVEK